MTVPVSIPGTDDILVLSVDGGGTRGLIPALLMEKIEEAAGSARNIFQAFAGTSTGGLLVAGLARPDRTVPASTLVEVYRDASAAIFPERRRLFRDALNVAEREEEFDNHLRTYLGGGALRDAAIELIIPAVGSNTRRAVVFTREGARQRGSDLTLRDTVLATSAAPTYLPPHSAQWDESEPFVDGGLFAANPAQLAAVAIRGCYPQRRVRVLSLGCGVESGPATQRSSGVVGRVKARLVDRALGEGEATTNAGWVRTVAELCMDATSSAADALTATLLREDYLRVQATLQGRPSLDDSSGKAIATMEAAAATLWDERGDEIFRFIGE